MAVLKVLEIMASSNKSWEQATANGVKHASESVKNIRSAYVQEQSAVVTGDTVTEYRVNLKISFEVI
ncbi:dodecin family protein [Flavimarina sp. Hel_I_48]|uniref:dodecin family protein n=1 Tax=Flavimarina sp. Hel_I_48 TaxID=1392488 RepID=UPI0004DEEB92|nr:dodecin family protein [Flavimarina sp. Hel_I_48]